MNHPSLVLLNTFSETTADDSNSSDFAIIQPDADYPYAYVDETQLKKEKSLIKSATLESAILTLAASHSLINDGKMAFKTTRTRANSGPIFKRTKTAKSEDRLPRRPKILRYIQDFSKSFEEETVLLEEIVDGRKVTYSKAKHELDGQVYVLKKEHIYVDFDQDIKEHPAYRQILEIKDSNLPLHVRYVNSWIEREVSELSPKMISENTGINIILVIQMCYVNDFFKLAKDLIISTQVKQGLDEDTIDDMADDAKDEIYLLTKDGTSFREAAVLSLNKIGLQQLGTPNNLEQVIWKL